MSERVDTGVCACGHLAKHHASSPDLDNGLRTACEGSECSCVLFRSPGDIRFIVPRLTEEQKKENSNRYFDLHLGSRVRLRDGTEGPVSSFRARCEMGGAYSEVQFLSITIGSSALQHDWTQITDVLVRASTWQNVDMHGQAR